MFNATVRARSAGAGGKLKASERWADAAALLVVAAACAKRLGSAAGALAGFVGSSYLVNVCAALGIGLTQCMNQIVAARRTR